MADLALEEGSQVLFVLDRTTFEGKHGDVLIAQLQRWLVAQVPIIVVRIAGAGAGGLDRSQTLASMPQQLVRAGLLRQEPIAWYEGAHLSVSMSRLAVALGATKAKTSWLKHVQETRRMRSAKSALIVP
jgi:hypothetical protein